MACPCGVGESFETCCEPIIAGKVEAETAEALMRARYSAYTTHKIDFLLDSVHADSPGEVDRRSTEAWAKLAEWHGLEVIDVSAGGKTDSTGVVEFVAKFSVKGQPQRHHERATFRRQGKAWRYYDGVDIKPQPVKGPRLKLQRNDPCPCGSGKKLKKCCGPVWESGAQTPAELVRARFGAAIAGEADYLSRSLHPEAKEPSNAQDEVVWRGLSLGAIQENGDLAEAVVGYEAVAAGQLQRREERHRLKRHGQKWLHLSSETIV